MHTLMSTPIGVSVSICYSNPNFGCNGAGAVREATQQCCDEGFLSFQVTGSEACEICPSKCNVHTNNYYFNVFI